MTHLPCKLCSSTEVKSFLDLDQGQDKIVQCLRCGLVYLDFQSINEESPTIYSDDYWWRENKKQTFISKLEKTHRNWLLLSEINRFKHLIQKGGKILDVGCGNGDFLKLCQTRGFAVSGVETAAAAAELAKKTNKIDVFTGELPQANFPSDNFDAVTLFHVLEHLPEPALILKEVHRILKNHGLLIIQLPNIDSWQFKIFKQRWFGLQIPYHLYHFSPETLKQLLKKAGFKNIKINHFSFRCNPMLFVSSLLPNLSPHAFLKNSAKGKSQIINKIIYFALTLLASPWTMLESILGHGAVVTVLAEKGRKTNE
ncbi:MAG: class I SAM-dependent methyltransferase [bacterium]